jgi:hypothetical protein
MSKVQSIVSAIELTQYNGITPDEHTNMELYTASIESLLNVLTLVAVAASFCSRAFDGPGFLQTSQLSTLSFLYCIKCIEGHLVGKVTPVLPKYFTS